MDMKISGSGCIGGGEYDNIHISGSGKVEGPVRCKNIHCSGSVRCKGTVEASKGIHSSGSTHVEGNLQAGDLRLSGSCTVNGDCIVQSEAKISGSFRCDGDLKANLLCLSGSSRTANIEAEEAHLSGNVVCTGLLNAEKINIKTIGTNSEISSIGGSIINISQENGGDYENSINLFFFKYKHTKSKRRHGHLIVKDSIEGDEITLDHVTAKTVIGRIVKLGSGCHIEHVQYSQSIEVAPDAEVGAQEQI